MQQTQVQVQALITKRQQFKAEIEAESTRLLEKRRKELAQLESEHESRIQPIKVQINDAENLLLDIGKTIETAKTDYEDAKTKVVAEQDKLTLLSKQYDDFTTSISTLEEQKRGLEGEIDELEQRRIDLQKEPAVLFEEISTLKREKQSLLSEIPMLESQKQKITNECEQIEHVHQEKVTALEVKQRAISATIRKEQDQHELIREDLAIRTKALDKRDLNIRVRERKVNEGEESIRRNAELLNL